MVYMSRQDRRCAILDAAVSLVRREGLSAATVRGVAQILGCSPGQIHHHFPSADVLRAEAIREIWNGIAPVFEESLRLLPLKERLFAILSKGFASEDNSELRASHEAADKLWREAISAIHMEDAVRLAVLDGIDRWRGAIIETLEEGRSQGLFTPGEDAMTVATRLIAAVLGYDLLAKLGAVQQSEANQAEFVTDLLAREGL